jgi:hypothetical protein
MGQASVFVLTYSQREKIKVMPRYSLRTLLIVLAVGPAGLFVLVSGPQMVWDGRFTLNVQFVNETGISVDRIEAAVVGRRAHADLYVSFPNGEQPRWRVVELDNKGVAQLDVNCSGHESWLTGYELSYWQQGAIVTRVEYSDGSRSLFVADIPLRGVRNLVVRIPRGK